MRREASAYQLSENIFIHGKKRTIRTVPIPAEPVFKVSIGTCFDEIGRIIRSSMESFSEGHEHPSREDFRKVNEPLVKLAGLNSVKSFFTKVKFVPIVELNGIIAFGPSENHGWKEGFKNTMHPPIELDYIKASDDELGKALIQALEYSSIL